MSDDQVTDLLVRLADMFDAGPPPVEELLNEGGRRRRRRSVLTVAGAAAVVLVVGAATTQLLGRDSRQTEPVAIPPNSRLVGMGHAAIAVPRTWPFNLDPCGGATARNTVVIYATCVVPLSGSPQQPQRRPRATSAWTVVGIVHQQDRPMGFYDADTIDLDGTPALRTPLTCATDTGSFYTEPVAVCEQEVWVPSEMVKFGVTSTDKATIQRLVATIRIVPNLVGVPRLQAPAREFTRTAHALGLNVVIRKEPAPHPSWRGQILRTAPRSGIMAPIGSTIVVTVGK